MLPQRAQRANRYRLLAEEIRSAAASMTTDSRQTLRRLAEDYDLLADKLDRIDAIQTKKSG